MELLSDGGCTAPVTVLDKPYHLSYPFVFGCEGEWYMVPETVAIRTVELYRCKQFPYQWEFVMNLAENRTLIDCTLCHHDGKWWLFAYTQNHSFTISNDQLMLYYADNLFSTDWKAHPQNSVSTDISNCRPAGKIFLYNGKLYRPVQNNASRQYGYGLKINRIEVLNSTEYREVMVNNLSPASEKKFTAVHTFNFIDEAKMIDGIIK